MVSLITDKILMFFISLKLIKKYRVIKILASYKIRTKYSFSIKVQALTIRVKFNLQMIFILETELLEKKSVYFSLTSIFGINQYQALIICKKLGLSANCKLSILTSEQIVKLIKFIEKLNLLISYDLKKSNILLTKKQIQIKTYKSIRKLRGLPVRGQRTHTNGKTAAKVS